MEREDIFKVDPYSLIQTENRDHSLLSSSDSLPTTSQASYSLPGSRRNSTDAEEASSFVDAFESKLKIHHQDTMRFLTPHRSMSIDETAMKQKLIIGSTTAENTDPHGTQRLLFDHDSGNNNKVYFQLFFLFMHIKN